MLIALSTLTFDLDGYVLIDAMPSSEVDSIERRVSRIKTLDGGVAFSDAGFAHGDRTLRVRWKIRSAAQWESVQRLVQDYGEVQVAQSDGCYVCAPARLSRSGDEGTIELMVLRKAS
jgi:hypothetical protein